MKFGEILDVLNECPTLKAYRKCWKSWDMFIWLKSATVIKSDWCKDPILKELVDKNDGELLGLETLCQYGYAPNGQRSVLAGWMPSQTEMLADDWMIIDDNQGCESF